MNILTKIVTPSFITWNAHMWFSAFAVSWSLHFGAAWDWLIPAAIAAAGFKEYWIDARYELNQSFSKNTQDFAGYLSGIIVGVLINHL